VLCSPLLRSIASDGALSRMIALGGVLCSPPLLRSIASDGALSRMIALEGVLCSPPTSLYRFWWRSIAHDSSGGRAVQPPPTSLYRF
jgi:hypothetical protein